MYIAVYMAVPATASSYMLSSYAFGSRISMHTQVGRIPKASSDSLAELEEELEELREMAKAVPQPPMATTVDQFFITQQVLPRMLCQQFRCNAPVTCRMLMACFDPDASNEYMNVVLSPVFLPFFVVNEVAHTIIAILTKQV